MKITVIYDNRKDDGALQEGWGFSALVEDGPRKVLFDTGASAEAFFSNMGKLRMGCEEVTHLVFSHRHGDHTAGIERVLGKLSAGTMVVFPKFFSPLWFTRKPSGVRLKRVGSFFEIDQNIYAMGFRCGFFLYEQVLVVRSSKGLVIVTGCAHPGIVKIVDEVQTRLPEKVHLVMGGFHLFSASTERTSEIVRNIQALGVEKVAPCHCSGDLAIGQFREAFGDNFMKIGTGTHIVI